MYYPLLRTKQFEMIALRELCEDQAFCKKISPILVPVGKVKSIRTAIEIMARNGMVSNLVLNSSLGSPPPLSDLIDHFNDLFVSEKCIPTIVVRSDTTMDFIVDLVEEQLEGLTFSVIHDAVRQDMVAYLAQFELMNGIIIDMSSTRQDRNYKRKFRGKKTILLDDYFQSKERNKDYLLAHESQFSSDCYFFQEDGFAGFADYTITGARFTESGFRPYAVAIHLTIPKPSEEMLYIRHYVSDSNDSVDDVEGKYQEALDKVAADTELLQYRTSALNEILNLQSTGRYRGLGYMKKLMIKHHIEIVKNQMQ